MKSIGLKAALLRVLLLIVIPGAFGVAIACSDDGVNPMGCEDPNFERTTYDKCVTPKGHAVSDPNDIPSNRNQDAGN